MKDKCKFYRMDSSFSEKIYSCLVGKVIKFNQEHKSSINADQLIRVYKRGEKAAQANWQPQKTIAQWALARVNLFLKLNAEKKVCGSYKPHDMDIIKGTDRTYTQENADPFWEFSNQDFIVARTDLLLAHITDEDAQKTFYPPSVEE